MNSTALHAVRPESDGRSRRWRAHRTARRAELVRVARRAVHRLGPDASMDDIAAAAGTSKSVFYRYFGDKAGLQHAVAEHVLGRLQDSLHAAAANAPSPFEGVRGMVHAYLQLAASSPRVYAFVTAGPVGGDHIHHFFGAVSALMSEPMRRYLQARADAAPVGAEPVVAEPTAAEPTGRVPGCQPGSEAVLRFWPTAAIGLVRNAGEQWLATPDGPGKPGLDDFADLLTGWLLHGVVGAAGPAPQAPPADAAPDAATTAETTAAETTATPSTAIPSSLTGSSAQSVSVPVSSTAKDHR